MPSEMLVDVTRASNCLFNDISNTIHESITINAPQYIPVGCAFFYREYLIYTTLNDAQLDGCTKI
jgi:hypothetical protein